MADNDEQRRNRRVNMDGVPVNEHGYPTEEEGLEEGDLIQDYVMPLRSLFSGAAAPVMRAAARAGKSAIGRLRERGEPAASKPQRAAAEKEPLAWREKDDTPPTLNYKEDRIGFSPTHTETEATTGWKSWPDASSSDMREKARKALRLLRGQEPPPPGAK